MRDIWIDEDGRVQEHRVADDPGKGHDFPVVVTHIGRASPSIPGSQVRFDGYGSCTKCGARPPASLLRWPDELSPCPK